MKIYLVGMPGSGKTTLGKKLAKVLAVEFVDLDEEIEKFVGSPIPQIFLEKGEAYFRQAESRMLTEQAASKLSFVMATGGGAPCFHNGMDVINKTGISIYLDVPVSELVKRVKEKSNRPLLADVHDHEKTLLNMLETRQLCYRKAGITVTSPNLDKVLEAIHFKRKNPG
jgi:shikimate kinase